MEKLIITAAICGAEVTKQQNPHVPYTVEEIAQEAEGAYQAGASIIHLHVRYDDGTPTQDQERFRICMDEIRKRCPDVIIQPSTGGAVGMGNEERIQPVYLKPEMATLDCGTCNFGGNDIFVNTETTIMEFAQKMDQLGVRPEIEVFDKGMVDMALRLKMKGLLKSPMHFNFVLGVNGGISASPRDLLFLSESIPDDSTFTVTAIGRNQLPMTVMSILMGGHVRVGFEDNIYISRGTPASSNSDFVKRIAGISMEMGREVAKPNEARKILGITKG